MTDTYITVRAGNTQITELSRPPIAAPVVRYVSQFAFRSRVTDELVAQMELAAMHSAADTAPVQLDKARRRAGMARCWSAQWLDLDSTELRGGFTGATAADLTRIFDAPVRDQERP